MAYLFLAISIIADVIGTLALKASNGLTQLGAGTVVIIGYTISFYCLSLVLKVMPVGVAYAIWSGMGIVLITLSSAMMFGQRPDIPALLGMGLIISGVFVINLFSRDVAV